MTVIDDKDEDGLASDIAPPLISYRKWGIATVFPTGQAGQA